MKQHSIFSVYKNQLLSFVRKEFYHVLRDRKVLLILFGMPVVQVLLFGFVLSNEVKNSKIIVVDYAKDAVSQAIITKISASHYFDVINQHIPHHQIDEAFKDGKIKAAVVFPENLSQQLLHQQRAQVQFILDATDVNTANTINGYLSAIIYDYVVLQNMGVSPPFQIISETRMLYNPELKGAPNFVPGVMAMVLLLVCVLMTAVAIVKEKEMGTMEVLLVSPIKPFLIIISKAIPYLLLSFINLLSILLVSVYILDVPIRGSVMLLLAESTLFIITCLSLGILISIRTSSQQVAMLISLVGMLLPTLMLSGFMFPIENMPYVLQLISNIVPSRWYYIIVKDVMIKGAGFSSIWQETIILVVMTVVLLVASLKNFKIRLA
jgi:ABC-2 type transport system permease protein